MLHTKTIPSFRKLNAAALASQQLASSPLSGQVSKSSLSQVVKRVCPALGVTGTAYHVLDILLGLVKEKDLDEGRSPVVAISNNKLANYVCRSERSIIRAVKKLVEVGFLAYRDSGNGRRFVNSQGEAYGLDLTPACKRLPELRQQAEAYKAQLDAERALKRRSKGLARAINDACAELLEQGKHTQASELHQRAIAIMESSQNLSNKTNFLEDLYEEVLSVTAIEFAQCEIEQVEHGEPVEPVGNSNRIRKEEGRENGISIEALARALPMAVENVIRPIRSWNDLRMEAETLRVAIGLSEHAWKKAIQELGLNLSAACLAVVVEKVLREPDRLSRPAGYFNGMVAKARLGELNLNRTVWSLACNH
ncbi:plasmid replication protein RepC [Pseudovibrio sp. Tun.PSC04-5.I4]|uniref:plasmid replication protein RepC n=1 Tax=Pseudovibrio sp. Tun.PSC04-5.I4 TaxID=1798213 RepID=UPI000881546D|nr:plasmid replication protein RepC [Pseudovibrio sp. Tun.PSC04-5.I4]SDQ29171.1 Replication protein C C-terminal region [Pseudovibrio sp. Tun.PSC04-5.I4]